MTKKPIIDEKGKFKVDTFYFLMDTAVIKFNNKATPSKIKEKLVQFVITETEPKDNNINLQQGVCKN